MALQCYTYYLPKWLFHRECAGLFCDVRSGIFFYSYYNMYYNRECFEYDNGTWVPLTYLGSSLVVGGRQVGVCRVFSVYFEKYTGHSLFKDMTASEVEKKLQEIESQSKVVKQTPYYKILWNTTNAIDYTEEKE